MYAIVQGSTTAGPSEGVRSLRWDRDGTRVRWRRRRKRLGVRDVTGFTIALMGGMRSTLTERGLDTALRGLLDRLVQVAVFWYPGLDTALRAYSTGGSGREGGARSRSGRWAPIRPARGRGERTGMG